ncbi:MAG: HD domain-containing protein [Thermoplasmatota archaeon]
MPRRGHPPPMLDISLLKAAGELKRVRRQGWLEAGVPRERVESVADHCFRTALIVAFYGGVEVDRLKAIRMALIHDLGESAIGDLTPRSGVSRERKAQMEEEAVRALGNAEVLALYREYVEGETPVARLVYEADVLEMLAQARELEMAGHPRRALEPFWEGWSREIVSPGMRVLVRRLLEDGDTVKYSDLD